MLAARFRLFHAWQLQYILDNYPDRIHQLQLENVDFIAEIILDITSNYLRIANFSVINTVIFARPRENVSSILYLLT